MTDGYDLRRLRAARQRFRRGLALGTLGLVVGVVALWQLSPWAALAGVSVVCINWGRQIYTQAEAEQKQIERQLN